MKKTIFTSPFLLWISFVISSYAQSAGSGINIIQTIEFLNIKLGKDYQVELSEDQQSMFVNSFKNGSLYKTDKVYLSTLGPDKVSYSEEEKVLILRCRNAEELKGQYKKFKDGCFEREFIEKKTISAYGRLNLDVGTDRKKINSLQKAFVHLIKLSQDNEYSSNAPFE